jgi:hypothetical protein
MRRVDSRSVTLLVAAGLSVTLGVASCEPSDVVVVRESPPAQPPSFDSADASTDATAAVDGADVPMCPVTTCSLSWATCPSSRFPCDTNLLNDDQNCGGCGIRCPAENTGNHSKWTCVEGKCTFGCVTAFGRHQYQSCDGDPTNGCESDGVADKNNCGACGNKCADGLLCQNGECIDFCELMNLPDRCGQYSCANLKTDDRNCGSCGVQCDPTGPSLPALPSDMYYGCGARTCGVPKCLSALTADCNGDVSDGCEVTLNTDDHCTHCNDACGPGKFCGRRPDGTFGCLCPDGETYCGSSCVQLDDDPFNCGGCNNRCPGVNLPHYSASCSFGVCGGKCQDGFADCDHDFDNGCEVDTRVDNRNCGGCGRACLPDQVCFQGTCLTAPCDAGTGGPTK